MITRDEPQVFSIREQPAFVATEPHLAAGCTARVVSRQGAAATLHVDFPAGWRFEGACEGATEIFVLEGALEVGGRLLASGAYCHLPPAARVACSSAAGATAFVFSWPPAPAGACEIVAVSSWEVPWEPTVLPGFPSGAMHKSLRPSDATGSAAHGGAGGFLRLVLTPPGWLSADEERHVGCWEENILLRGDMLMPNRGVIRSGDCLANPPGHWHGPMVTKGGAFFLVNCDAPMPVEYRPHPQGAEELHDYLMTAAWE